MYHGLCLSNKDREVKTFIPYYIRNDPLQLVAFDKTRGKKPHIDESRPFEPQRFLLQFLGGKPQTISRSYETAYTGPDDHVERHVVPPEMTFQDLEDPYVGKAPGAAASEGKYDLTFSE